MKSRPTDTSLLRPRPSGRVVSGALAVFLLLLVSGCAAWSFRTREAEVDPLALYAGESAEENHGGTPYLGDLMDHIPAVGYCRVWYPRMTPRNQPPPRQCDRMIRHVPAGAWFVSRPVDDPERVYVYVNHPLIQDIPIALRIYEVSTGMFVRAEAPY